jgi:putative colanic acid biosynthesis acetyltransferase WcaB
MKDFFSSSATSNRQFNWFKEFQAKMNNITAYILQDWEANQETSFKSRLVLLLFRTTKIVRTFPLPFSLLSIFFRVLYQLVVEWLLSIDLPWNTEIGPNLKLQHGLALVVNHETKIGANCTLRQSTTIGNKKLPNGSYSSPPQIGNNVEIGANSVIIGPITIGDNAVIGAGSVVVKDVPEGTVVAGNPARVIRTVNIAAFSGGDEAVNTSELASVLSHSNANGFSA